MCDVFIVICIDCIWEILRVLKVPGLDMWHLSLLRWRVSKSKIFLNRYQPDPPAPVHPAMEISNSDLGDLLVLNESYEQYFFRYFLSNLNDPGLKNEDGIEIFDADLEPLAGPSHMGGASGFDDDVVEVSSNDEDFNHPGPCPPPPQCQHVYPWAE